MRSLDPQRVKILEVEYSRGFYRGYEQAVADMKAAAGGLIAPGVVGPLAAARITVNQWAQNSGHYFRTKFLRGDDE